MGEFWVVLTLCMVAAPSTCRHVTVDERASALTCPLVAELGAAKWIMDNPGWELSKWVCQLDRPDDGEPI